MEPTELTTTFVTEKLKAENPRGVELYYVDYRDELEEDSIIQEILEKWYDENGEIFDNWDTYDTIECIIKEAFTEEEYEVIRNSDVLSDAARDRCRDNDQSEPMKDLIRHTSDQLCLVDLDFHFDDYTGMTEDERIDVCKGFLIHIWEEITEKNVKQVHSIYLEAYYGGTAYAMINADLSDFYGDSSNSISLSDLKLGIIDTYNGSGDYGDVDISKPIVRSRKSIVLDSTIPYWVGSIFGRTEWSDGYKIVDAVVEEDSVSCLLQIKKDIEEEKQRAKDYAKNKCAWFSCHKTQYHETYYQNEWMSCGHKCKHCHRLWLD